MTRTPLRDRAFPQLTSAVRNPSSGRSAAPALGAPTSMTRAGPVRREQIMSGS
ncbi:hypothetical protein A7982_13617 [Minicystis rosea]|nr:hypothetical protein A7982_13617 [Minicystis rosea]